VTVWGIKASQIKEHRNRIWCQRGTFNFFNDRFSKKSDGQNVG
jgi:hypothetical protein